MEQPTLTFEKAFVRDLEDGQAVDSVFVVRDRARRQKRNGDSFLKLQLADVTGAVEAVIWDEVDDCFEAAAPGAIVRVRGSFSVDQRFGSAITVRGIRAAADEEYDPADLLEGPSKDFRQMCADLEELLGTIQDPHLRALLDRFFARESKVWGRWSEAPAAKYYHQAYRHGLLEHCLSVAQGVSALAATFPGIDREVAVAGGLLHDIGKVEAYGFEGGAIDMTDLGKLHGEIPLGYYAVRREIEQIPGFPPDTAAALLHIILSHHGKLEHGSPVVPCTREAALVHFIDNLGGTLGSFDRIEKSLGDGERWSQFDRGISASAYFASRESADGEGREAA